MKSINIVIEPHNISQVSALSLIKYFLIRTVQAVVDYFKQATLYRLIDLGCKPP